MLKGFDDDFLPTSRTISLWIKSPIFARFSASSSRRFKEGLSSSSCLPMSMDDAYRSSYMHCEEVSWANTLSLSSTCICDSYGRQGNEVDKEWLNICFAYVCMHTDITFDSSRPSTESHPSSSREASSPSSLVLTDVCESHSFVDVVTLSCVLIGKRGRNPRGFVRGAPLPSICLPAWYARDEMQVRNQGRA